MILVLVRVRARADGRQRQQQSDQLEDSAPETHPAAHAARTIPDSYNRKESLLLRPPLTVRRNAAGQRARLASGP